MLPFSSLRDTEKNSCMYTDIILKRLYVEKKILRRVVIVQHKEREAITWKESPKCFKCHRIQKYFLNTTHRATNRIFSIGLHFQPTNFPFVSSDCSTDSLQVINQTCIWRIKAMKNLKPEYDSIPVHYSHS